MRRIVIILIILLVLGGGAFYFWKSNSNTPAPTTPERTLHKISEGNAISPINSFSNDAIWYGLSDGRMMRYDINARTESEYPLPSILGQSFIRIFWPPTGNDFIAQGDISGVTTFSYFNYGQKKYMDLPRNIQTLAWLSDSRRIVYVWKSDDGQLSLNVSDADGSGYRKVADVSSGNLVLQASPIANTVLVFQADNTGEDNKVYEYDLDSGSSSELLSTGHNTGVMWAPQGNRFAYTQDTSQGSEVFVYDRISGTSSDLGIQTAINKLAFSQDGNKLYAAMLNGQSSTEGIFQIDLTTYQKTDVFDLPANASARNILVVGEKIYYVNANDNKLYGID